MSFLAEHFRRPDRPRLRDARGRFVPMPPRPLTMIERLTLAALRGPNPYAGLIEPKINPEWEAIAKSGKPYAELQQDGSWRSMSPR